jgi:thiamine-phosphate pyrophosphorylase
VPFTLPKIYPITDTTITNLSHTEQVKQLLQGGATLIQLREKLAPPRAFIRDAEAALLVSRAAEAKLIVNDRADIALAIGADGVHLGQTDMPVEAARRLLGDKAIIGLSTHNFEQAKAALKLPIDYLAFGPIYPTRTKTNPDQIVGLKQLGEVKALAGRLPVVAIGGIDDSRVRETLLAGADSVAIISALLCDPSRIAEKLRILTQYSYGLQAL